MLAARALHRAAFSAPSGLLAGARRALVYRIQEDGPKPRRIFGFIWNSKARCATRSRRSRATSPPRTRMIASLPATPSPHRSLSSTWASSSSRPSARSCTLVAAHSSAGRICSNRRRRKNMCAQPPGSSVAGLTRGAIASPCGCHSPRANARARAPSPSALGR